MSRLLFSIILCIGVPLAAAEFDPSLQGVRFFAYQLQNFDTPEGLQALADSHYDLLVIDQTRSIKGSEDFDSASVVSALHGTAGSSVNRKKVVCYLDAGQAEDFRWYWQDGWGVGNPEWIVAPDPDWPGDYPVKFWRAEWKAIMKEYLARIIADHYDGVYLDWMEIYAFEPVAAAAQAEGLDPRAELIAFIHELKDYAWRINSNFFFIAQNAAELGACRDWLNLFSGIGQEDVWFTWGDNGEGDVPQDPQLTVEFLSNLALWKAAGKVVFDIEYAEEPANTSTAYANGKAEGFITYATLKELDQLSSTPPPDYMVYNLTSDIGDIAGGPVYSPDGQRLAFSVKHEGLYTIKADGTQARRFLDDPDYNYFIMPGSAWNPVTNRICFTTDRGGASDIWSIRPDGTDLLQVTHGPGNNRQATYSPDGAWIVFSSDRDGHREIYKRNLGTGEEIPLTENFDHAEKPNWSPQGDWIVFGYTGSWPGLYRMDPASRSMSSIGFGLSWDPSFSPDGQWVVYMASGDFSWDPMMMLTWVHEPDGGSILFYDWSGSSPTFSPDGKNLAWVSGSSGSVDLWTMPIYLPPSSPHERPVARP